MINGLITQVCGSLLVKFISAWVLVGWAIHAGREQPVEEEQQRTEKVHEKRGKGVYNRI